MSECVYDSDVGEFVDFATLEDWEMRDREKTKRIEALEAKLARAAEVLEHLRGAYDCSDVVDPALAELKGENDE